MNDVRRRPVVIAAIPACLLLAGCFSQSPAPPEESAAPTPVVEDQVPAAADLGTGWTVDDSPEGGEHAELGDAGWATERDPAELIWGLAPLGCPDAVGAAAYPLPTRAVQGRYLQPDGRYAVALRLTFDDDDAAGELLLAMGADAASCTAPAPAGDLAYHRTYTVAEAGPDALRMSFTESGAGATDSTWVIQAERSGADVALLYVEQGPDAAGTVPDLDAVLSGTG